MRRRSQFLTALVCLSASLGLANTASAQFANANWHRWNWSILYPGDQASFAAAGSPVRKCACTYFAVEKPHEGTIQPSLPRVKPKGRFGSSPWRTSAASARISQAATRVYRQFVGFSLKFETTAASWVSDLKSYNETVSCAQAARLETESRRQAEDYWQYYEDRERWLAETEDSKLNRALSWTTAEFARLSGEGQWIHSLTNSLSAVPARTSNLVAGDLARSADALALNFLDIQQAFESRLNQPSERLKSRSAKFRSGRSLNFHSAKFVCDSRSRATSESLYVEPVAFLSKQLQRSVVGIEVAIESVISRAVTILSWVPVEAIGYFIPD